MHKYKAEKPDHLLATVIGAFNAFADSNLFLLRVKIFSEEWYIEKDWPPWGNYGLFNNGW